MPDFERARRDVEKRTLKAWRASQGLQGQIEVQTWMDECPDVHKGPTTPSRPGATNEVTSSALRAINQTGDSGGPIATDPIKDDQTQCPLLLAGRPYYRLQLPTWSVALLQTWMSRWRLTPSAPSQCSLLKLPALTAPALNATPRPSPGPLVPGPVPVPRLNTRLALSTCTHTILTPPPTCFTLEACQQSPELAGLVPSTPSRRACDRLQPSLTLKLPGFLGKQPVAEL